MPVIIHTFINIQTLSYQTHISQIKQDINKNKQSVSLYIEFNNVLN